MIERFLRTRARRCVARAIGIGGLGCAFAIVACSPDFATTRDTPPRGTVGHELFGLLCDRVGAQALREDITGASFHAVCHPDANGNYAAHVDRTQLVALDPNAVDVNGNPVPLVKQQADRDYDVARIESLAADRDALIAALDATLPDAAMSIRYDDATCGPPIDETSTTPGTPKDRFLTQVAATLSRFIDLYDDGTIPLFTESLGGALGQVATSADVQAALARLDARQGYRPAELGLGVIRPIVGYPSMVAFANSLLRLVATDSAPYDEAGAIDPSKPLGPDNRVPIPGPAALEFQALLAVAHNELRIPSAASPTAASLTITPDATLDGRPVLSRPRTTLELSKALLLASDPAFTTTTSPVRWLVARDARSYASVPLIEGKVPSPFVDDDHDGLPDLDALGQFVTVDGTTAPTPLVSPDALPTAAMVSRDGAGRALSPLTSTPMYGFLDASQTFVAPLVRNVRPLLEPDPTKKHETLIYALEGLPVLSGTRDATPATHKTYPPDPFAITAWNLTHTTQPPASLATTNVDYVYRGYHPDASPVVDLAYAVGQIAADPTIDDALALFRKLVAEHPQDVARLIGLGLRLKAIADAHPEAHLPAASMFWDDMLGVLQQIAHQPGVLEELFKALGNDASEKLGPVFAAYAGSRDVLTYDPNDLNGPAFNQTVGKVAPISTPVDRTMPDVGDNRSELQKFMQLLHDAKGLGACTKAGAVAHVNITWNGIPIALDYPTNVLTKAVCAFLGSSAPSTIPECGILRFPDVSALLLDVALNRAKFDIRDDCLNKLASSPLTAVVGGIDAFLDQTSGITGFDTHPTVGGVARLVYVNTPHDGLPGDTTPAMQKTVNFLTGVIDPIPSMVCPIAPFTDTDGTVINLRKCSTFDDTLRGRDDNALFPLEQDDFIATVGPLAAAFADNDASGLFVSLFDTMHLHWGSTAQPPTVCDPTLPKTDARWCSQDGAVTYEALLVDMLGTDLFDVLHDLVGTLEATTIEHCDAWDTTTNTCTSASARDGVTVLAEATRTVLDPARWPNLVDRQGNAFAVRNDGTHTAGLTPAYLMIDALKGIDASFAAWAAANPTDDRLPQWRLARSQIVDQLFTIDGTGTASTFHEPAVPAILPVAIDVLRGQVFAHCAPSLEGVAGATCTWASHDLVQSLETTIESPTYAASLDLIEKVRADDTARFQLESLAAFLLDAASADDAQATTLTSVVDALQVLDDSVNLDPVEKIAADACVSSVVDGAGKVVRRGLVDAAIEALSHILAQAFDGTTEVCSREVDPNASIDFMLKRLITPQANGQTPLEVLLGVAADVNRADPSARTKLAGADYANITSEVQDFLLNEQTGLEQVYEVVREATDPSAAKASP